MDAFILSLVAKSKLARADKVETFDDAAAADAKNPKTSAGGSIMFFVIMLAVSCYAGYLSWTRNGSFGMATGPRKILYAIVAFLYGLSYLTSYAVFLRQTGIR
jgi:hypothetical protein